MKRFLLTGMFLLAASVTSAQKISKKPLDHSVYDGWQTIASDAISNDTRWVLYAITPQEGDAELFIRNVKTGTSEKYSRVNAAEFTQDSKYAVFLIKPFFKDTREAKIKKKAPADMPKDSLGIVTLGGGLKKVPAVKSFKTPATGSGFIAYLVEKTVPADSLKKKTDGALTPEAVVTARVAGARAGGGAGRGAPASDGGDDLIVLNLALNTEKTFKYVTEYQFSKDGKQLLYACAGNKIDSVALPGLYLYSTGTGISKKISSKKGAYRNLVFDETGSQMAFTASKGPEKAPVKINKLYYYQPAKDSAVVLADQLSPGMAKKWSVSDNQVQFSRDGRKLYFSTAPVPVPVDTTIVDFEVAKVDIWNYKDDYIQPMQLKNLDRDLKRSYQAVINLSDPTKLIQLADEKIADVDLGDKGNAMFALGNTDYGNRVEMQWTGSTIHDLYLISTLDGSRKKIASGLRGNARLSPSGNFVVWYSYKDKSWYSYSLKSGNQIALNANLKESFFDEENDVPDDPSPYGIAGFMNGDKGVLIYDRYDVWKFDLSTGAAENVTNGFGRKNKIELRYSSFKKPVGLRTALNEDDLIGEKQLVYLKAFNTIDKENGWYKKTMGSKSDPTLVTMGAFTWSAPIAAKKAPLFIYEKSNYTNSPNIYVSSDFKQETQLSTTNIQQANYNWGTAELFHWTTSKGHASDGILYKPEDFDPTKKYPMIVYFYEKLSDGLYSYNAPAPTPSRINISYFVSNGYLVFAPDISYETGHPGESAMEYINSGVEELKKNGWVDAANIGLQGQSWGGYQVAYLVTHTNMYKAAWAGAPVANMTSAYGGIRWETGLNRQFQYEKTQSRIGATLWENPQLYIENSPLFALPNVKTPLMIMSNDADGAVPWYQGIELFTGLRRLNKPVWLLNYNGEAHNLVLRQNRKDIQKREQQFFDHFLKSKPMPAWMERGVPATEKGKNWGFELPVAEAETGK